MKVCKKCKKHVANKMKICKYCGADVSKAKIIKNNTKNNNINKKAKPVMPLENKKYNVSNKDINLKKDEQNNKINKKNDTFKISDELKNNTKKNINIKSNLINKIELVYTKTKTFLKKLKKSLKNNSILNTKLNHKVVVLIIICLIVFGCGSYFGVDAYRDLTNAENTVVVGEKATNDKIFGMGDLITYNGVDYKVVKVETSEGNNYKSPKEGNQFLIVTVYMKNNTGEKVEYSYKNWTMSNSKGEEEKRIFTSINVDTALYSGDLVIGGIKTGSMVFEQPINDPKLRMNFYELKKDVNGEYVINKDKKIFSVSIKVPEKEENDNQEQNSSAIDDKELKTIKTSDKNQN